MEDKSKVYIFHIGEILLIILLIILLAAFSFTMGYRVGKKHTDKLDGFSADDQQLAAESDSTEIKSDVEEDVEKKISQLKEKMKAPAIKPSAKPMVDKVADKVVAPAKKVVEKAVEEVKETKSDTYNALKEAFDKMDKEEKAGIGGEVEADSTVDKIEKKLSDSTKEVKNDIPAENPTADKDLKQDNITNYTGKHTIQLGSYKSVEDAKNFASGFKVRGYNPIIYEVDLSGKGTWYRVNLGVFDSVSKAREYIEQEESLFKGTDYVIGVF